MKEGIDRNNDYCIACGSYVPEGRMVCPLCEKKFMMINDISPNSKKPNFLKRIKNFFIRKQDS